SQMVGHAEASEPLRRPGTHLPQDVSAGDRARSRQLMQVTDRLAQLRGDGHRFRVIQAGFSDSHPAEAPGDQVWPSGLVVEEGAVGYEAGCGNLWVTREQVMHGQFGGVAFRSIEGWTEELDDHVAGQERRKAASKRCLQFAGRQVMA